MPTKLRKQLLINYIIVSLLFLTDFVSELCYKISLAGYWSDRILFWTWVALTATVIFGVWRKMLVKIYFGIILATIVLSIIPMGIFLSAGILSSTGEGLLYHKQISPNYRIQVVGYSIMSRPFTEIVEKKGLLEREIVHDCSDFCLNDTACFYNRKIKDVSFVSESKDSITIQATDGKIIAKKTFKKH